MDYLLRERLELEKATDPLFLKFLAECLHPMALRGAPDADFLPVKLNEFLEPDGFQLRQVDSISGRPVYSAVDLQSVTRADGSRQVSVSAYEIALSFAGEDRQYVEEVAAELTRNGVSVFYDRYEEVTLWGKDLAEHLDRVYRNARYCVIFISQYYAKKVWTNHEQKSALARAVETKDEYLLPARFDDTELAGVRPTIGYVTLAGREPKEFAQMILQKLEYRSD